MSMGTVGDLTGVMTGNGIRGAPLRPPPPSPRLLRRQGTLCFSPQDGLARRVILARPFQAISAWGCDARRIPVGLTDSPDSHAALDRSDSLLLEAAIQCVVSGVVSDEWSRESGNEELPIRSEPKDGERRLSWRRYLDGCPQPRSNFRQFPWRLLRCARSDAVKKWGRSGAPLTAL